jgi:uncharacterized protein
MKQFAQWTIVLFFLQAFAQHGLAQSGDGSIKLLAKSKKDGIWLRWAPVNPNVWQLGNQYGYVVERFTVKANGDLENPLGEKLTSTPLRVLQPSELDKLSATVKEAKIIKELVYGNKVTTAFRPDDPKSVLARSKDMENMFGVALLVCDMGIQVAEASGLFMKDLSAKKGVKYIYRVSIPYQNNKLVIEPGVLVTEFTDEKELPQPYGVNARFDNHKATLNWSTLLDRGIYSAYHVEKSEDGKSFTRLTQIPYVHMTTAPQSESAFYVDSLQQNSKTYYYRIIGLTPFGESGPTSQVVSGEGKDDLSGLLVIREGKVISGDNKVTLKWEFPQAMANQIGGFSILKSNDPIKKFSEAATGIPSDKREFMEALTFNNTYYMVVAIDKNGNERARSFPFLVQMEDITPPAVPTKLSGSMTKNGVAQLTWSANGEKDLKGYRVFKSNKPTDEFVEITKSILSDPSYSDTINTNVLNKKVYYRVVAVDKSFNVSEYTPYLIMTKPDVVSPAPPLFIKTEIVDGKINLEWENSVSDDVARYVLLRRSKLDTTSVKILEWPASDTRKKMEDNTIALGQLYRYMLTAFDSAGNKGSTSSRDIFYETGVRSAVAALKATADRENKTITLQWQNGSRAERVFIYRKKNDEPFILYQTLEGNVESFKDTGRNIPIGNVYVYKVQLGFKDGIKSVISAEAKVKF